MALTSEQERQAIATVNGNRVDRDRVVNLLLRSHGPGIIEQIIVLEAARDLASKDNLVVTQGDIREEYERALSQLTDPLHNLSSERIEAEEAELLLDAVLAQRNISREEYMQGMERNALLRKLVTTKMFFSTKELETQRILRYGERLQIRHIQLASLREVGNVQRALASGEPMADVASRFSANTGSARRGGLLLPFSPKDPEVPEALRKAAASLEPGEVSKPVKVGSWYHIIMLEQRIPAVDVRLNDVRSELEADLRDRLAGPAMQELYLKLFDKANVQIHDPILRDAFERQHPDR